MIDDHRGRRASRHLGALLLVLAAGCHDKHGLHDGPISPDPDAGPEAADAASERFDVRADGPSPGDGPGIDLPAPTCDGHQCPPDGGADVAPDAGPISCGSMTCAPDEYCVSRSGGPAPFCYPHPDGGPCPAHTTEFCSVQNLWGCQEVRDPGYDCLPVPASCPSQEPCQCLCSLQPGPMGGCFIDGHRLSCNYP